MFNLFKPKQPTAKSIEQQIHNDVYSAQELILQEAKRVLAIPPIFDSAKAERLLQLEKLGFHNFDEIKKLKQERDEQKQHSELNAMINYYRRVYPFHRFISQESVQVIIKKYELLLANAGDYIAEIPEKNQQEIINFKVRRKDIRYPKEMNQGVWLGVGLNIMPQFDPWAIYYKEQERMWAEQSGDADQYFKDKKVRDRKVKITQDRELLPGRDLLIIAPQHKLDTTGKVIRKGILINKDPIVLQPVICGYLIVSSWGLEAADPLVVNAINN